MLEEGRNWGWRLLFWRLLFTAASTKLRLLLYRSLALVEGRRLLRMFCSLLRICIGPMPGMLPRAVGHKSWTLSLDALSLKVGVVTGHTHTHTGNRAGQSTHTFRACPAPPHTRTARPLHADTDKRVPHRPSWPAARVRSHGHGGLAAAAAQPPREANPLWPCGTPGRDGAEAAAKAAASPGSNPPPRGSRGAGSACPATR